MSHMMKHTTGWIYNEKITHTMGKVWVQFPRFSQYDGFSYISPYHEKLMGKPIPNFQYDEVYHMMGIWWGKSTHTMEKVWLPISHTVGFPSFSGIMGNWWGNPCISYMMRLVNLFLRNIVKKWQKQQPKVFCKKKCCQKFSKFHTKKNPSVLESFLIKLQSSGLQLIKEVLRHRCFLWIWIWCWALFFFKLNFNGQLLSIQEICYFSKLDFY